MFSNLLGDMWCISAMSHAMRPVLFLINILICPSSKIAGLTKHSWFTKWKFLLEPSKQLMSYGTILINSTYCSLYSIFTFLWIKEHQIHLIFLIYTLLYRRTPLRICTYVVIFSQMWNMPPVEKCYILLFQPSMIVNAFENNSKIWNFEALFSFSHLSVKEIQNTFTLSEEI